MTLCNSLSLKPFMKLSVYEIVCIAQAWTEFVAGLFSSVSFCKSTDPPWTPAFCSRWFCIREQRYCFGCFSNLLSQITRHYAAAQLFLPANCMSMAFQNTIEFFFYYYLFILLHILFYLFIYKKIITNACSFNYSKLFSITAG